MVMALALAACGRMESLEGRWTLESLNGEPNENGPSGARYTMWIGFHQGRLSGWDGCNNFGAPYVYEGGLVGIDPDENVSTRVGCGQRATEFKHLILGSGSLMVTFDDTGKEMTLRAPAGSAVLSREGPVQS